MVQDMSSWKKMLLKKNDSMSRVIKSLESEGMQIALIIDERGKLLGTITDGDIRRALIRQKSMDTFAGEIMFTSPIVACSEDSDDTILTIMKNSNLNQIPILNADRCVVGLETLQRLLKKEKIDTPVCLMAGGFGKRLLPLTDKMPKPLLKVGSRPILETTLNQFIKAGFHNFFISIYYKADMVREYFGDGQKWNVSINYLREKEPLGTAGALGLLPESIPDSKIIVMNGDLITKVDYKHILQFHNEEGSVATMCVREYDLQVPYGVVKVEGSRVKSVTEKPIHSFFVNAGIYVLNSTLVQQINGSSFLDMTQFLEQQIKKGDHISMFPMHEYWIDIGRSEEYKRANRDIEGLS
jgi:dTDP-glucose pyrophosphorylase/predicted transcriptional regulator